MYKNIALNCLTVTQRTGIDTITETRKAAPIIDPDHLDVQVPQEAGFQATKSMNISLLKELVSIEKQTRYKMKMEQFVLLFNKNADQGINSLINSNIVTFLHKSHIWLLFLDPWWAWEDCRGSPGHRGPQ